ncbi:carbohydrate ABC transporter permease [Agromyces albus]|uniref:Carbohydrate ABC transporter permease n=1 Tax=Agromyces albus TaxID=205332 RepID=A0A4Q2L2S3_9MICO|nr:carbohydrate ABC transporter permease [Agromyces albus]RXZ71819.1 carbohydrate ABC transporter permease [Agromyces albus]
MRETLSFKAVRAVVLTVITGIVLLPLYVVLVSSFKPLRDVSGPFTWLPETFTIEPYIQMWSTIPLAKYLFNSLIVTTLSTALALVIAVLAAFALARLRWRGQRSFSLLVLSTQMFPGILFLLPLYLIFTQIQRTIGIQLNGNYAGLIITYMTFSVPFATWMLMGFFASIPDELEEAAMIDGTTRLGAFLRVVLPVVRPGIVAVGVFTFLNGWGEVLFASVLTTSDTRTLAVGLQAFSSQVDVRWNEMMAASIVISLPVLIAFLLVQRHLVQGLAAGAVK